MTPLDILECLAEFLSDRGYECELSSTSQLNIWNDPSRIDYDVLLIANTADSKPFPYALIRYIIIHDGCLIFIHRNKHLFNIKASVRIELADPQCFSKLLLELN